MVLWRHSDAEAMIVSRRGRRPRTVATVDAVEHQATCDRIYFQPMRTKYSNMLKLLSNFMFHRCRRRQVNLARRWCGAGKRGNGPTPGLQQEAGDQQQVRLAFLFYCEALQ